MEFQGQSIRMTMEDGLARVILCQPDRGNPIDGRLGGELLELSGMLMTSPRVRAVLMVAEGRFFSVGGDLNSFKDRIDELPKLVLDWTSDFHTALARLRRMDAPMVCAVEGGVAGGAVAMMAFADVIHAADSVKFTAAFPAIGFCADSGTTVSLSERMGIARARRFILCNETIAASEAQATGLVDHLHPLAEVRTAAEATAQRLAQGPTRAYGMIKRCFSGALGRSLDEQLEMEAVSLSQAASFADAREGITAFVQKRKADFTGS
ncbi:2-(1,2-epoxy-1,2-dihydrophenyl)acetyl-CoA isomerase [Paracoccus alkenifer]|uniref:2-(1,2-epoxy-1,2-dihydrophenyl)acetyl-CoA isomerase n=2 Tax=Paracoccus alkenifer TaxID=65735 RepID=A0A1H6NE22_9RHOB|nr:2-(1,2-epoxy-1,2-dihydrophenyl)acetyl-CoA isomerase [Paracoccus alkenifer]